MAGTRTKVVAGTVVFALATLAGTLFMAPTAQSGPTCFGEAPTEPYTSGSDSIKGTSGEDVIFGGDGADVVQGKQKNDLVCGGDGDDELHGGEGQRDKIDGGTGEDFLDGRRGEDNDRMFGGPDKDKILGGNVLKGGSGDDLLKVVSYAGDLKKDTLDGGPDTDTCKSDGGGDTKIDCE
jgi:Ca2+-binding RTX toxin-like protein